MKITLSRINDSLHMEAENESGNTFQMDGSPQIGGENLGFRPMQTVIAAAVGCSSIDILSILKKKRQHVTDFKVTAEAETEKVEKHTEFRKVHMHYQVWGEVEEIQVEKAISLSVNDYCSVSKLLEKTAVITTSFEVNPA